MSDTSVSCETCPSFLAADAAEKVFKKNIGSPMCARFGHVLGKPGLKMVQQVKITKHFATNCDSHGKAIPIDAPAFPEAQVSIGNPKIQLAGPAADADRNRVTSCLECKHYVKPEAVRDEMGFTTGLCAATGRLVMPHRTTADAVDCEWRAPGANLTSTDQIPLMPIYSDAFGMDTDPIKAFLAKRKSGATVPEPVEHATDRPVRPVDEAAGIISWRRIDDPEGSGKFTFLPVYSPDKFDVNERGKIPVTGSDEHPEMYVDFNGHVYEVAVMWRQRDETPFIWGIAGTGKTELFRHCAWLMGLPFDRLSVTASTDVDDLIGKMLAKDGATYFQYGRLPKRWVLPGVILLDEPNTGPEEVWQTIRPLTDNSKQLVIDQNNGERLSRNLDCFLGMAGNPAHDIRNIGANPMADADGNRLVHLKAMLPPEAVERAILEDRCAVDDYKPAKSIMDAIMKIATDIRGLSDAGELPISWGLRPQIKVIGLTEWFGLEKSYNLAVGNMLEDEQAQVLMDIVRAHTAS